MVRDEISIDIERFLPSGRSHGRLKQTSHVLDPLRNATPSQNQNFENEEKTSTESKNSINAGRKPA
jgi:hypothetical protein